MSEVNQNLRGRARSKRRSRSLESYASAAVGAIVIATVACGPSANPQLPGTSLFSTIEIPRSIRLEHEEIHAALERATEVSGSVGVAAKELADVLHPHFVREEQIALPPLGLLAPLAAATPLSDTVRIKVLAMSDSLRSELPRMMAEHQQIRAAVGKLRDAARSEKATEQEELADQLSNHALTEEEVLYPAAVLVGDLIRVKRK